MKAQSENQVAMQRVKVGMIGLAAVVLLIAIASAIMGAVTHERPIATAGSAQADVVANMALADNAATTSEPLAEMGVAPVTANSSVAQTSPGTVAPR